MSSSDPKDLKDHSIPDPESRKEKHWLKVVIVAAILARLVFLLMALRSGKFEDSDNYMPIAHSLAEGKGFSLNGRPTAYRPPLYPLLLAPLVLLPVEFIPRGIAAFHLALGAATVLLTAFTARRWGLSSWRIVLAAAIVAFDPVLISQSNIVMTETLAAMLSAATLLALTAPRAWSVFLGGLALGLSVLCRPSALAVAVLTSLFIFTDRRIASKRRVLLFSLFWASITLVLLPWAIRNAVAVGSPVFTTTHGGYTLALANNDVYYDEVVNGPPGSVWTGHNQWLWWDSVNRKTEGLAESEADRMLRSDALRVIRNRPGDFVKSSIARLGRFWGVSPAASVYSNWIRMLTASWTVPLWGFLIVGLCRPESWKWPRGAAPATLLGLSLVHSVYWTDMRMRSAAVPAIALVTASCTRVGQGQKKPSDQYF